MDGDPRGGNGDGYGVQEFSKAMQIACSGADTSIASTQNVHFFQNIEGYNIARLGWGTPGAKPVTLSFWVRCNVPGTYCVGLENNATDRCCIREYEIKPGHKWQKIVLTFPGCRDGTWEVTNSAGIRLRFVLASGSTYDDGVDGKWVNSDELTTGNQENFMSSTNNRYFITGVQLEAGRVATDFEHRQYNDELALCQRYYVEDSTGGADTPLMYFFQYSNNYRMLQIPFPVPMRTATPTVSITMGSGATTTGLTQNYNRTEMQYKAYVNVAYDSASSSYIVGYTASAEL